ncbi:cap-specific mRNA (nucleoside-2'-O-)-methyltransferase 2 [Sardina pilchardus]|uniref:cap-specific mRNA (nucleoside-2'-O-)-methyltransferase 2 n=1 Tax=Sardina pilchardus TaxID=27697 RepID=UPI002E0E58FE
MSGGRGGHGASRRRAAGVGGRGAAEPPAFSDDIMCEVQALFSKVRGYRRPEGEEWRLPEAGLVLTEPPHIHPRLQQLKRSLNAVKNRLSDQDLDTWHQHTCATHRAGTVTAHLRSTANAELCTQAWAKFYEVLGTFELLPAVALQQGELHSVHLCEAPGAFVSALNHFLRSGGGVPCDWTWVANTLNPYHEANGRTHTIADDRLLARTLPWWFFGSDNTGDVMRQEHLLELQALVRRHGDSQGTHLVTADGSFDCQEDPGEQEAAVAPLQLCEAVCALMVLAPGGSLVLKVFTLLEHSSVSLLYLLCCCFRRLRVFKPATSKPGNSELYVVCVCFRPPPALRPLLAKLLRLYGPDMTRGGAVALFPGRCIPRSFLRQHEELCAFFHDLQVATITENLELFALSGSEVAQRMEPIRECTALYYTQRFQVRSLSRKSWLTRGVCVSGVWALSSVWSSLWAGPGAPHHQRHHQQRGSYNQRQQQRTHTWRQRLTHTPFHQWAEGHRTHTHTHAHTHPTLSGPHGHDPLTWYLVVGGALEQVRSSPFCEPGLLGLLNQALAEEGGGQGVGGRGGGKGQMLPVCFGCVAESPHVMLAELSARPDVTSCLVLGQHSWWGVSPSSLGAVSPSLGCAVEFCPDPCPAPWLGDLRPLLHDGEPSYQRDLLRAVLAALPRLPAGGALVVPLRSALTRLTSGLLLALHLCFRSLELHCPAPGPAVCVLCVGFQPPPPPPLMSALQGAMETMTRLEEEEGGGAKQVLQIAPMEELLRGDLPHFLCCLNANAARQRLHLMLQH